LLCSSGDPNLLRTLLGLRGAIHDNLTADEWASLLGWFWPRHAPNERCRLEGMVHGSSRVVEVSKLTPGDAKSAEIQSSLLSSELHAQQLRDSVASFMLRTEHDNKSQIGMLYVPPHGKPNTMFHGLPNLPARFVTQRERGLSSHLASVWTSVEDASEDKSVTALLREFDPGTQSISVAASEGGRAYLRVQHDTLGRVPLEFQGAGFGKALSLSAEVIAAKNGILLIDEFEDSLHVGAQGAIAAFLLKAARKYGVQLFITTHSLETIDALVERFDASKELFDSSADLRVHQFMKTDEGIRCRTLDFEKAKQLRNDFGLDLRRSS
jgi:hypothetical protein